MKTEIHSACCAAVVLVSCCALLAQAPAPGLVTAQQDVTPPKAQRVSSNTSFSQLVFSTRNPRYSLRPGDVLEVTFTITPEYNQTLKIQPDGFISLRDAGDIHVAGKTVAEASDLVLKAYVGVLHEPILSLVLKEFDTPHFTVAGQVGKPGRFDLRGNTTTTEAIAIAGGLTEKSKHSQVLLLHPVSDQLFQVRKINLKEMYKSANFSEEAFVQPGDIIYVPQNTISKIAPFLPSSGVYTSLDPAKF